MPSYCTKEVNWLNKNGIEYMIVIQKSSNDDFDPIIKKLYIEKIYNNDRLISLFIKGTNFNFNEFKKTNLLKSDCEIIIKDNIQETTILLSDLPKDIYDWYGDIAFLFMFLIKINDISNEIINKINKDIEKNEVRRKDHISRRAFERFNSLFE